MSDNVVNIVRDYLINGYDFIDEDKIVDLKDEELFDLAMSISKVANDNELVNILNYISYDKMHHIFTANEVEKQFGLKDGSVRSAITRGRLKRYVGTEIKRVGQVWLLTDDVVSKEYDPVKK